MLLKRISTVLLLGGLIGLVPTAAGAAPSPPQARAPAAAAAAGYDLADHRDDDHYRCMYRCGDRDRYDRDRHRHKYDRRHRRYCWYRDHSGWYKAPCGRRHRW